MRTLQLFHDIGHVHQLADVIGDGFRLADHGAANGRYWDPIEPSPSDNRPTHCAPADVGSCI